jgi:acetylornithine deacetylase
MKGLGAYGKFPDPAPVQVLAIESNRLDPEVPLSVPSEATLRLYFQFLPHEDVPAVITDIRHSLKKFEKSDPFFRRYPVKWKPLLGSPLLGHELPLEHPWSRCMIASVAAALGKAPVVTAAPYPCDAFLVHRGFGIPTLLFGPKGAGAHNPDEYVETESIIQTAESLLTAALEWCGG